MDFLRRLVFGALFLFLVGGGASPALARTVTLAWDANTEPDIAGYKIYYRAGSAALPLDGSGAAEGSSPIDVGSKLSTSISGLADGQSYYFAITAYNSAGYESSFSNIVASDPSAAPLPPPNRPPVLAAIGAKTVAEGSALSFTVSGSDPDGQPLSWSASGLPAGATFTPAARTFSWTPGYTQAGSYSIVFTLSDGTLSVSETVAVTVTNVNRPPVLAPIGGKVATEGSPLVFTVSAVDPDSDPLSYSASPLPAGAIFSAATRSFSWTPPAGASGSYAVIFAASDGKTSASETVTISVQPPLMKIRALSGTGGRLTPSGDLYLKGGASQSFTLVPDSGYVISDLRVDGVSVGPRESYTLTSVTSDRTVEAIFKPVPAGLSYAPGESGIPGIARVDGGNDADNLVAGKPDPNVEYLFRVVYQDASVQVPLTIYLKLNGYAYEMTPVQGEVGTGALYAYKTRLGPAPRHTFRFEARDPLGNVLWRLPQQGEIAGPRVELLGGRNFVGVPGDAAATYLNSTTALGTAGGYRWISAGLNRVPGRYRLIDSTGAVKSGEGYSVRREALPTLPEPGHPEIAAASFTVSLKAGWNLIANPYRGNVPLSEVQVKRGKWAPVPWGTAAANGWVENALFLYQGNEKDPYGFESALALPDSVVVPWVGYWIYVKRSDSTYQLIFPKPAR